MDLDPFIRQNQSRAVEALREQIEIDSSKSDPVMSPAGEMVYPFGQGVQDAFSCFLSLAEELGFHTLDADHYGGHAEFGKGRGILGIIGHLDVVPAGDGCDFDLFSGEMKDGYILGRGTTDDKGPFLAALFACRALMEFGYEPKHRIRLIAGLDEETDWIGINRYFQMAGAPDYGFVPDAVFPVVQGEKGLMRFDLARKTSRRQPKGLQLRKLTGGTEADIVPSSARALVFHEKQDRYERIIFSAEKYSRENRRRVKARKVGKSLEIVAWGRAACASSPDQGVNAISVLMDFLGCLDFADDAVDAFIRFYNEYIGFRTDGGGFGCACEDEKSGPLTFCASLVRRDPEALAVTCDVRYPVTCGAEDIYEKIISCLAPWDIGLVKLDGEEPLYFEEDHPLLRTCLESYRETTGDRETSPIVTGSGTFAKAAPNIIAFGGRFPGDPDLAGGRNEKISIERYLQMIRIYAEAIVKLDQLEDFDA